MKCLMKMFSEEDKGVIFYETVISLKHQKHTVIECVPLPWEAYDLIPGYFKVCITLPSRSPRLLSTSRNLSSPPRPNGLNTRS